jgi:hypothetical protein
MGGFKFRDRDSTSSANDWVWYGNAGVAHFWRPGAGDMINILSNGNVGIGTDTPNDKLEVNGVLRVDTLGTVGGTQLCRNLSNQISNCSSSLRYKTNINPFSAGLSFIRKLRPITFDWKQSGTKDVGFGAEDVVNVNPLFVTYNDKGEVEGVKYDRLSAAFVNAFKEQQAQIETLRTVNSAMNARLQEFEKRLRNVTRSRSRRR